MSPPVASFDGVVHGIVGDGSMTFCGLPVPEGVHLRDLLIGEIRDCPSCFDYRSDEMFDQGRPVDDDPPF